MYDKNTGGESEIVLNTSILHQPRCHSCAIIYRESYIYRIHLACRINSSYSIVSMVSPILFALARPENHLIFVKQNEGKRDRRVDFVRNTKEGRQNGGNERQQLHSELHIGESNFRVRVAVNILSIVLEARSVLPICNYQ